MKRTAICGRRKSIRGLCFIILCFCFIILCYLFVPIAACASIAVSAINSSELRGEPSSATRVDSWKNLHFQNTFPRSLVRERTCGTCAESSHGEVCSKFCAVDEAACGMPQIPTLFDSMLLSNFLDEGFQQHPLLIRSSELFEERSDASQLSLDAIFGDFQKQEKTGYVRVVKDGENQPKIHANSSTQTLLDMLQSGYSFSLQVEYLRRPNVLSDLTVAVEDAIGVPVTTHVYLSSPSVYVFGPHRDPYGVIVLQLFGSKTWTICSEIDGDNKKQPHRGGKMNQAERALYELQHGNASIGTLGKDEELECEQLQLSTLGECGEEKNVLYIPTGVVHAASAGGDTYSLSISFGLLREGLTWESFLKHLIMVSGKCQTPAPPVPPFVAPPMCSQAEEQLLSLLSTPSHALPEWGQLPTIAGRCTTNSSAPFTADASRASCETLKRAARARIRELDSVWRTMRAAQSHELYAYVEDLLRDMATEMALDEAIRHYIIDANRRIQRHRDLDFRSPCGRRLMQTPSEFGVSIDDPGVFTVDQCTSSCDDCRNRACCGCDGCRDCSWGSCDYDCACGCDCQHQCTECDATCSVFTCKVGYFNAKTHCMPCAIGSYAPSLNLDKCLPCDGGHYQSLEGQSSCTACPAGSYSIAGASNCTECGAGKYSVAAGASTCTDCGAGKYSSKKGSTVSTCTNCDAGKFSSTAGASSASTCTGCGPGKYLPTAGNQAEEDCISCQAGTYSPSAGASTVSTCVPCGAGKFSSSTAAASASSCLSCPPGTFSEAPGATQEDVCQECEPGKYQSNDASTSCEDCPLEKESSSGSTSALDCLDPCPAGYTGPAGSCSPCPAGRYKAASGSGRCEVCPANSDSLQAQSECLCNAGFTEIGSTCVSCLPGKFKEITGNFSCSDCGAGKYSAIPEATTETACTDCPAGRYSSIVGASAETICLGCPSGKRSEQSGASSSSTCQDCEFGKYSSVEGASTCVGCMAGKYSGAQGNKAESDCMLCDVGKYSSSTGASSAATCLLCGAGKYSISVGNQAERDCVPCVAGTFSSSQGASTAETCVPCTAGTFSTTTGASSHSSCTMCPAGKYNGDPGASRSDACLSCEAGKFVETQGNDASTDCISCDAGKFSPSTAAASASSCLSCPPGTFSEAPGATQEDVCQECEPGKYQSNDASTSCEDCPLEKESSSGSTSALDCLDLCPAGYTGLPGKCSPCQAGTYKPEAGSESCLTCPSNAHSSSAQAACRCRPGFTRKGSTCVGCSEGKYKVHMGDDECDLCGPGKYSALFAANSSFACTVCVAGKYLPGDGADSKTMCIPCARGKYSADAGATSGEACAICDVGKYGSTEGASSCTTCPHSNATEPCLSCPGGKFLPRTIATSVSECSHCPPSCLICATGTYSPAGSSACSACAANMNSEEGSTSCKCNAGFSWNDELVECAPEISPTPPPSPIAYLVRMSLALPMAITDSTPNMQVLFDMTVATVAGVSATDVTSNFQRNQARRLFVDELISIDVNITAMSASHAESIASILTEDAINAEFSKAGLPLAIVVQDPTVCEVTVDGNVRCQPVSRIKTSFNLKMIHIVFIIVGVAVGVAVPFLFIWRRRRSHRHTLELELGRWGSDAERLEAGFLTWIEPAKLTLRSQLGSGSGGVVMEGILRQGCQDIQVAVKMMPPVDGVEENRQFKEEVESLLKASSRCNGVTRFYGTTFKDNRFCIVMKRYPDTLARILLQNPDGLPVERVKRFMEQLSRTLAELHEQGIAHQDLKPANLFIDHDDVLIVGDFGIAKIIQTTFAASRTTSNKIQGTWNYMSPEAFDDVEFGDVTLKTDIWGFAACALEMFSGKPPYHDMTIYQITNQLVNNRQPPQIPDHSPFDHILRQCFNVDQTLRPTAQELTRLVLALPRTFNTSNYKREYTRVVPITLAAQVLSEVQKFLSTLVRLRRSGWTEQDEVCVDAFCRILLEETRRHAEGPPDTLDARIGSTAELLWTSPQIFNGMGDIGLNKELCSLLNLAIREDDAELAASTAFIARALNKLCVVATGPGRNAVDMNAPFPPDGICWRGTAFDESHRDFFTQGKRYRVPGFLATSFSRDVALRFILNNATAQGKPAVLWKVHVDPAGEHQPDRLCKHVNYVARTHVPDEQEYLFTAYSVFTIHQVEWSQDPNNQATPHKIELHAALDNQEEDEDLPLAPWY